MLKWRQISQNLYGKTTHSAICSTKSVINAPGKSPNVPGKKKLEFEYARFYAPLKVSEKNDSGTKWGPNRAYAPFSLVLFNQKCGFAQVDFYCENRQGLNGDLTGHTPHLV